MKPDQLPSNPEALRAARDVHDRAAVEHMRAAKQHLRDALTLTRRLERIDLRTQEN